MEIKYKFLCLLFIQRKYIGVIMVMHFHLNVLWNPDLTKEWFYLLFGGGSRNCIGMRFALMQGRSCTVFLVKNFNIQFAEDFIDDVTMESLTLYFVSQKCNNHKNHKNVPINLPINVPINFQLFWSTVNPLCLGRYCIKWSTSRVSLVYSVNNTRVN